MPVSVIVALVLPAAMVIESADVEKFVFCVAPLKLKLMVTATVEATESVAVTVSVPPFSLKAWRERKIHCGIAGECRGDRSCAPPVALRR